MKKKAARKAIRKNLSLNLAKELTENLQKLGAQNTGQLEKFIKKSSKRLARKLVERADVDLSVPQDTAENGATVTAEIQLAKAKKEKVKAVTVK